MLLLFIAGFYRYSSLQNSFSSSAHKLSSLSQQKALSGTAVVLNRESSSYRSCLTLKITHLKDHPLPPQRTIRLYLRSKSSLLPGDTISFRDLRFKQQSNKGYERFLFKEGIVCCSYIKKLKYKRFHRPWINLRRWRMGIRNRLLKSLSKKLSPQAGALLSALFLGMKKGPKKHMRSYYKLRQSFTWWGIVHYLARSGLHVVLLIGIWRLLLYRIALPFWITQVITLLFLGLYYLISWASISFIRAVIAYLFYEGCVVIGRPPRLLHIVSLTALIVLIYNPFQLFYVDFQLSFGLTCGLALLKEAFQQIKRSRV